MRRLNFKWTLFLLVLGLVDLSFSQDRNLISDLIKSHPVIKKGLRDGRKFDFTTLKTRFDTTWVIITLTQTDTAYSEKYRGFVFKDKFQLHGSYTIRDQHQGTLLRQSGTFVYDQLSGLVSNYNDNMLVHIESFLYGRLSGPEILYVNNKVQSIYSFLNDTLDGSYTIYFDNGSIKEFGHYNMGVRTGLFISYYENGKIKTQGKYTGNFIGAQVLNDSNKMGFFLNNKTPIDFTKDYSLAVRTEFSEQMKTGQKIYFLKEGIWENFSSDGRRVSSLTYSLKGDLKN